MEELVIHPQTRVWLEGYLNSPAQALLLTGPAGSGKASLAASMLERSLGIASGRFSTHQYTITLKPSDTNSISIEEVRRLERFLNLKVPSSQANDRAVIIQDAHLMTAEAQNALLKTLEEPPAGTLLILTATHPSALLPTVRSRVQALDIYRPDQNDLTTYFKEAGFKPDDIKRAYAMSGGLPGLMRALLEEEDHPLGIAAQQARELLGQNIFERLITVDSLAKKRELAIDTVTMLQQMAHISLQATVGKPADRWQRILRASYDAADAVRSGGQLKLVLIDMALKF